MTCQICYEEVDNYDYSTNDIENNIQIAPQELKNFIKL